MRYDPGFSQGRVTAIRDAARGVREIEIAPERGALPYAAGSHIDLRVPLEHFPAKWMPVCVAKMRPDKEIEPRSDSIGTEKALGAGDIRSYSLVGEPSGGTYRIAVKAQSRSRGGSLFMWSLETGDRIDITSPIAGFELGLAAPAYLMIAGGIGITPLIGMAAILARRGVPFRFCYAGRSRAEMAYLGELQAMLGERLQIFAADEGRRIDLRREIAGLCPNAELYLCGPMRLLADARHIWTEDGRAPAALRFETFGSSGGFESVPFLVQLPRLGIDVRVPENVSMLDALEGAGVEVLADCRRGECGLCALDVIEADGMIDHRDVFFSDCEKRKSRKICACVSRVSGGHIVIDPPYRPD
jgi:ferredoxin-NADP reductase